MSARLLKANPSFGLAYAPFTIPVRAEPLSAPENDATEEMLEGGAADPAFPVIDPAEIEQQAQALLAAAQSEAEQLLAAAQVRVAEIEQEAYEKGLAAARAQADEEVNAAVEELRDQFTRTLTELEPLYGLIAARAERDLVKLALAIARKVVQREVTTDPDIVLSLARVALERLHPRAVATVLLHPEDFAHLNTKRQALSSNNALELVADLSVGRGGCIIQSEHGDIDARVEQQFASIERGFFE